VTAECCRASAPLAESLAGQAMRLPYKRFRLFG
jgi:hypothetical protein